MNKQALAFLTMFSLILMLSVYYVTLPSDSTVVMKEEGKKDTNKEQTTTKTEDDMETKEEAGNKTTSKVNVAQDLQDEINQKKDEEINKNSAVISDKDEDETNKKKALATMEELKDEKAIQNTVVETLKKAGYTVAVEIKDTTCIVSVFEKEDTQETAKKIMLEVSKVTNQKYFVEVAFK